MSPSSSHSGLIDIRGVTWVWSTLDPKVDLSGETEEEGICITFRTPVDPGRERRCVAPDPDAVPPSEEQLRQLFEQAWIVEL